MTDGRMKERTCGCGRVIRGSAFFKHQAKCSGLPRGNKINAEDQECGERERAKGKVRAFKDAVRAPKKPEVSAPDFDARLAAVDQRTAKLENFLKVFGAHVPSTPNGMLLTSKQAKSYLTQFIMNLEATTLYARKMLDLVDKQEIRDFQKSKGFDQEVS